MNKAKKLLLLAFTALSLLILTACGQDNPAPAGPGPAAEGEALAKITFVLDWAPNTNHTGLYVAQAQGYFAQAGLEVEIVQPPEDGAEVLVGSGKAQLGVSFQDTMAPALTGDAPLPITAVAAVLQHNTSGIISRRGEGLERPQGLAGKKYATWDLEVEKAMLRNVVEADGGDFSQVALVPSTVTDEVSALQSGSVDAIWIFYGWAGVNTEVAGLATDFFAFKDINPVFDYYTPVIIANNEFLEADPAAARAFLAALAQGYEYAAQHPAEAGEMLLAQCPELADSRELILASQDYLAGQYLAEAPQWGIFDPDRWNGFYAWLSENGLLAEEIPANTGFTNDYLPGH